MPGARLASWMFLLALTLSCAPARQPGEPGSAMVVQEPSALGGGAQNVGASAERGSSGQPQDKTLVIGLAAEVRGFSPLNNMQNKYVEDLVQGNLFLQDEQGRWFPAIAAEPPSIEAGTWVLHEDGTSEAVYKVKKGVRWHDGVEFTVHDLVFFWTVALDPEIPWGSRSQPLRISRMEPLDNYTLHTAWNRWESEIDTADLRWFWPMPRHILEETYLADKLRFINHPFWSTGFVGLGPYKLVRFEQGSHLDLTANVDYVLGPPKIKNIIVKFYADQAVLMSSLLAGSVQMTLHGAVAEGALSMTNGILLANQWSASAQGKVIFHPYRIALVAVQMNPDLQWPAVLADLRVRQALLHAVDRQSLVQEQYSGLSEVAHGWIHTRDPDYQQIADAVRPYEYAPSRARQLLGAAGLQPGQEGMLVDGAGQRLQLEYRAIGRDYQSTATIVADQWKRAGIEVQLTFVPEARLRDNEYLAKFPAFRSHYMIAGPSGGALNRYSCTTVPSPANNWLAQNANAAGYCTPAMEAHWAAADRAFPFAARIGPFKEMMRVALRDLPYLPLYFESEPVAVASKVVGVNSVPPKERGRIGMLVYRWDME